MAKYIDKDELEEFLNELRENLGDSDYDRGYLCAIDSIFGCYLNSLEVKEVDLQKEIDRVWDNTSDNFLEDGWKEFEDIAKHFFELGLNASNPITAADRGTAEEIIINLKRVEQNYHINLTKEIEWLRNKVKKGE